VKNPLEDRRVYLPLTSHLLMPVPVSADPTLILGSPRALFSSKGLVLGQGREFNCDVTPDGSGLS